MRMDTGPSGAEVPWPSPDPQVPKKEHSQESPTPKPKGCPFCSSCPPPQSGISLGSVLGTYL